MDREETNIKPDISVISNHISYLGIYPLVPLVTTWTSNNIGGSLKRGVGIAMQVGFGNLGGVISGFVYLSKDQPRYLIFILSCSFTSTLDFLSEHLLSVSSTFVLPDSSFHFNDNGSTSFS